MKIKPLQDWALIRPIEGPEKSGGGIIIPDAAREQPQEGEVMSIGEGKYVEPKEGKEKTKKEKTFMKTILKPGDRILYEKYAARKIKVDNEELVLVREEDVLGCISD